jgi:1-acyl-sn-glycerol-3-phosphate acyltransferase
MVRVARWIVTIPFGIGFLLTLIVHDIAGRVVRPFSLRAFEVVMACLQRTLMAVYAMAGTTIEVERDPEVLPRTGYAIIANHQSMFDIVAIGGLLFSNYPKYVAKVELGKWIPAVSLNLRHGGNALIDRSDRGQAIRSIKEMARRAQERGRSVVIFPEGTRSRDGRVGEFKRSGAEAMLGAADRLPVVPAAIDGSWRLGSLLPVPLGTKVRIRFGPPVPRKPLDAAEVLETARAFISGTLDEWRALPAEV